MNKYRKKPVIVEAEQFTQGHIERHLFDNVPLPKGVTMLRASYHPPTRTIRNAFFVVVTIHGQETPIVAGDWIMPEPDGFHYYPCKPDIFASTYEEVK